MTHAFDAAVVEFMRERFREGGSLIVTVPSVAAATNRGEAEVRGVLEELERLGALEREMRYLCPCERKEQLGSEAAKAELCQHCDEAFIDRGPGAVRALLQFTRHAPVTRDPKWAILLHGMNTLGAWQQEFSWLISQEYGYAVPVYIYKYGLVRLGAILSPWQRAICRRLVQEIRRRQDQMEQRGLGREPDIVAHSFGTWLIARALRENPTLRIGRLILLGSIVRPDFDWKPLLEAGQVEAVLCHFGGRDLPVAMTHYCIPDSGPSGRRGFNDRTSIAHVESADFGHSDYFQDELMEGNMANVWGPFLTASDGIAGLESPGRSITAWRPWMWPLRASVLPWALVSLLAVAIATCGTALALGINEIVQQLGRIW